MRPAPRFLASLGTLDEAELIRPCLQHLRRIGADLIIVTDYGSTDGTLTILEEEEQRGDIWLLHVSDNSDPNRSEREIALARSTGAEWVFFLDTDEFWVPAAGSLREVADLDRFDLLIVGSYDVVLTSDVEQDWRSCIEPERLSDLVVDVRGALEWPKVLARPEALERVHDGNHAAVLGAAGDWRRGQASDLAVAHFPFTTLSRFERKLANIRRFHERNPGWFGAGQGAHWLEWLVAAESVGAEGVFDRQRLSSERVRELQSEGILTTIRQQIAGRPREAAGR